MSIYVTKDQTETIILEDGKAVTTRYGTVKLTPNPGNTTIYLGLCDLVELIRIAAGSDAKVLEVLASNMTGGHRFRMDDQPDRFYHDEEDAF